MVVKGIRGGPGRKTTQHCKTRSSREERNRFSCKYLSWSSYLLNKHETKVHFSLCSFIIGRPLAAPQLQVLFPCYARILWKQFVRCCIFTPFCMECRFLWTKKSEPRLLLCDTVLKNLFFSPSFRTFQSLFRFRILTYVPK